MMAMSLMGISLLVLATGTFLCLSVSGLSMPRRNIISAYGLPITGGLRLDLTPEWEMEMNRSTEQLLLHHLMRGYDRSVRPVFNASSTITVAIGIVLTQIFDVDEKMQVLTLNVWLEQEWEDEMLMWDPEEWDNIKKITVPCTYLWLPDVVLYNNADDFSEGMAQVNAVLHYDGTVFWSPPTKMRSTCKIDVTYFPFDDQLCKLKLGSWIYDGFQVDVTNRTTDIEMSEYIENGGWEVIKTRTTRHVVYYNCCPEPFPDITFAIHIRRRTLFYAYNIILPCMMLTILTLVEFWLPSESGEKVTLGLTVLLAFSVFMLRIEETTPETSEVMPLIGMYIISSMSISAISVLMSITVLNVHHRGVKRWALPRWLHFLGYSILGPLVCWRRKPRLSTPSLSTASDVEPGFSPTTSRPHPPNPYMMMANTSTNVPYRRAHSAPKEILTPPVEFQTPPVHVPLTNCNGGMGYYGATGLPSSSTYNTLPDTLKNTPDTLFISRRQTTSTLTERGTTSTLMDWDATGAETVRAFRENVAMDEGVWKKISEGTREKGEDVWKMREDLGKEEFGADRAILSDLKKVLCQAEVDRDLEEMIHEWQEVSAIMDRFLFIFFFLTISTLTFIVLVWAPKSKDIPDIYEDGI